MVNFDFMVTLKLFIYLFVHLIIYYYYYYYQTVSLMCHSAAYSRYAQAGTEN